MTRCEVCGNDYDNAFKVMVDGSQHVFSRRVMKKRKRTSV